MAENQTLRNLLRSLAAFIGDGAGGLLPKLGWDLQDFNDYVNRTETDTAVEGYQKRKKAQNGEGESSKSSSIPPSQAQKRSAEGDLNGSRMKKARNDDKDTDNGRAPFSMLLPMSNSLPPPAPLYSRSQDTNGIFSELMRGSNTSPLFMSSTTPSGTSQYASPSGTGLEGYSRSYMPGGNMNLEPMSSPYESPNSGPAAVPQRAQASDPCPPDSEGDEDEPKKNEAYKLIQYVAALLILLFL